MLSSGGVKRDVQVVPACVEGSRMAVEGLNKLLERIVKSMQQSARKAQGERQGMKVAEGTPHKGRFDGGPFEMFALVREDGMGGREEGPGLPFHEQFQQTVRCDV